MIQEHLIQEWRKQLESHTQQLNKTGEDIKQLQQKIKQNVNIFVLIKKTKFCHHLKLTLFKCAGNMLPAHV